MIFDRKESLVASRARMLLTMAMCAAASACGMFNLPVDNQVPQTLAATASGHTYVPIDPFKVTVDDKTCGDGARGILDALPNHSVRLAISDISGDGKVSFAGSSVGVIGRSYRVVIDYINTDTMNVFKGITRYSLDLPKDSLNPKKPKPISLRGLVDEPSFYKLHMTTLEDLGRAAEVEWNPDKCRSNPKQDGCDSLDRIINKSVLVEDVAIPIYIGVGIRITSSLTVRSGTVNLAGLGSLAAAAQAKQVSGDLTIQTLGINGEQVTSAMPLPSELNPTTVQNAITAMATVKSLLFSSDSKILVTPRIVGFYDPLGVSSQQYVNAIVTELASNSLEWSPQCPPKRLAGAVSQISTGK